MKAEIITLTPEIAKDLISKNIGNRKMKQRASSSYIKQMKEGLWKENGEPIIIDSNGFIKDGQHRLSAVIQTGHSYKVPLITGVNPDVMDTIDTGTNRSLTDVLELNGFKYPSMLSSIIKTIFKHNKKRLATTDSGDDRIMVTNKLGLDYARENEKGLYVLCRSIRNIQDTSKANVLNTNNLTWFMYSIAGLDVKHTHVQFLKGIYSGRLGESSCTYYAYSKYLNAHINKIKLHPIYMFNLMARCWEIYKTGDLPISSLRVSNRELLKIN